MNAQLVFMAHSLILYHEVSWSLRNVGKHDIDSFPIDTINMVWIDLLVDWQYLYYHQLVGYKSTRSLIPNGWTIKIIDIECVLLSFLIKKFFVAKCLIYKSTLISSRLLRERISRGCKECDLLCEEIVLRNTSKDNVKQSLQKRH